jgi:hypothetical protein
MNFYYILYYKIYVVLGLLNKRNSIIEWSALFFLSIMEMINIVTIIGFIELDTEYQFNSFTDIEAKSLTVVIIVINYFVLLYKGHYKKILKHYKQNYRSSQDFYVLGYIAMTIIMFMTMANRSRDKVQSEQLKPWMKEIHNVKK